MSHTFPFLFRGPHVAHVCVTCAKKNLLMRLPVIFATTIATWGPQVDTPAEPYLILTAVRRRGLLCTVFADDTLADCVTVVV